MSSAIEDVVKGLFGEASKFFSTEKLLKVPLPQRRSKSKGLKVFCYGRVFVSFSSIDELSAKTTFNRTPCDMSSEFAFASPFSRVAFH